MKRMSSEEYQSDIDMLARLDLEWDRLKNADVLISGAAGMIGTVLVDVLMRRNRDFSSQIHIHATGRDQARCAERFGCYRDSGRFTFLQGDINAGITCSCPLDYIFHCASSTHPEAYASDPVQTIMTNVKGTDEVLRLAVRAGVRRVVYLSSVEIYGENTSGAAPFREEDCGYIDCNTLRAGYPEGKRTGEALCQAYISQYGLDVVIARLCRIYGPTLLREDSKAMSQFLRNAAAGHDIILKSAGTQYYSYCHVMDAAAALFYILFRGKCGDAYNVADEKSDIRLKDLAALLAGSAGTKVVFQPPDGLEAKGFSKATQALLHAEKLRKLGWRARYGIAEGVKRTIALLRA